MLLLTPLFAATSYQKETPQKTAKYVNAVLGFQRKYNSSPLFLLTRKVVLVILGVGGEGKEEHA